jgi:hypothetical protein
MLQLIKIQNKLGESRGLVVKKENSQLSGCGHRCTQGGGGDGERGGHLMHPLKRLIKILTKNAIKHENRGPPPRFSHNPMYPLKRIQK